MHILLTVVTILVGSSVSFAEEKNWDCEDILSQSALLRHFRGGGQEYSEGRSGLYIPGNRQLRYQPGRKSSTEPFETFALTKNLNFSSHAEIIKRQIGESRFRQAMTSTDPEAALAAALREDMVEVADADDIENAEKMFEILSAIPTDQPLPEFREQQVIRIFKKMGRWAEPLSEWLKPKILTGSFRQIDPTTIDNEIAKRVRPGVTIYKAIQVTALLNGEKTFFIAAGDKGPERVHQVLREAVGLVIPKERILSSLPGYIVVTHFKPDNLLHGRIEYVNKIDKYSVFAEGFDFRE